MARGRSELRGICDSPAIRLLNSGRILYTLNRADRFGAGGNAAGGRPILAKGATEGSNRRGFRRFALGLFAASLRIPSGVPREAMMRSPDCLTERTNQRAAVQDPPQQDLSREHLSQEHLRPRAADDERRKRGENNGPGSAVITRTKPQTKKPSLYRVLILNDDYTPMEFVVHVLERFFNKDREAATRIMLHVHHHGIGECGIFTYEVAETKVTQVMDFARKHQHPLQCVMEKK